MGEPNVDVMLHKMTVRHWREWKVYMQMVPQGPVRDDYRSASIVKALWDIALSKGKHKKTAAINECLLLFGEDIPAPTRNQSSEEKVGLFQAISEAYAGSTKKG